MAIITSVGIDRSPKDIVSSFRYTAGIVLQPISRRLCRLKQRVGDHKSQFPTRAHRENRGSIPANPTSDRGPDPTTAREEQFIAPSSLVLPPAQLVAASGRAPAHAAPLPWPRAHSPPPAKSRLLDR